MTLIYALGWTLLHFLWQGALIAILAAFALTALRNATARTRYLVSSVALLLMLLLAVATFVNLSLHDAPAPIASLSAPAAQPDAFLPPLVWFWFAGVVVLGIRSIHAWLSARRFSRRGASRAADIWQTKLHDLATRLSITKPVRLAISTVAEVPAVIGWLRPVVLMPASALSGLGTDQIESLLAHELAHICRNDYLVNLFQTVAETLFFYHPAIWWLNSRIREERENCCDDLAVEVCGNRIAYARALTDLEELRGVAPRFAMAAGGGRLLRRVERLLNVPKSPARTPIGWTVGVVTALLFAVLAVNSMAQSPAVPPAPPAPPPPAAPAPPPAPPVPPAPPTPPKAEQLRQTDIQRQQTDLEKRSAEMREREEDLRRSVDAMKERTRLMEPELQRLRETVDQLQAEFARHGNRPTADFNQQLEDLNDQVRRLDDAIHQVHPSN